MSKDFRFDRDRLEHKHKRQEHRNRRASRNHWQQRETVATDSDESHLVSATDLRRFGLRSA